MKLLIIGIFLWNTFVQSYLFSHFQRRISATDHILQKSIFSVQRLTENELNPAKIQDLTPSTNPNNKINEVRKVLATVIDPETSFSLIDSGKVVDIKVSDQNDVTVLIKAKTIRSSLSEQIKQYIQLELCTIDWISKIEVNFIVDATPSASASSAILDLGVSKVKHVLAVSSGKGGVGKSTVAVNLAYTLSQQGYKVGILDADIYGPSLPTMTKPFLNESNMITQQGINPLIYQGVKLMSMGFINKGAAIMRGPMVNQILNQLVTLTRWGELDFLVLDLPPGTGDVQLTLSQIMNITGAVIVTTPQKLSFVDVVKGIDMFDTVNIPCIAVVENMAEYEYPENTEEGERSAIEQQANLTKKLVNTLLKSENRGLLSASISTDQLQRDLSKIISSALTDLTPLHPKSRRLFGRGNNHRLREMWGIENIISLPIVEELAKCSDQGTPYVLQYPEVTKSKLTAQFHEIATIVQDYLQQSASSSNSYSIANIAFDDTNKAITLLSSSSSSSTQLTKRIPYRTIRNACRCAVCVEEFTGKKLLQEDAIPENIKPINLAMIGRYAVAFDWSDGHKSLYPFKALQQLADS